MKVIYHAEIGFAGTEDSTCLRLEGTIPFLPAVGMMLTAVKDDDFRKVEEVYWSQASGLEVFFEFEERPDCQAMLKLGWEEA